MFTHGKDAEYLAQLQEYYARNRSFPSYARLGGVLGLAAKSAVKKVLDRLAAAGFLERSADEIWVPAPRFFERPLALTQVTAGIPVDTPDETTTPFAIDAWMVDHPSRTVLVPVRGDSMIDAGIHDGDVAVVEKDRVARVGDLVVAMVDHAFTLKKLGRESGSYVLYPANPDYPVIRPREDLQIFGVVVGMMRKYRR